MQASLRRTARWLGLASALLAMAGCGSVPTTPRDKKPYPFEVTPKLDGGEVVRISVRPNDGNVRIKIDPAVDQVLTWTSDTEFLIRFERMESDQGQGGDDLGGPGQWTSATKSTATGKYQFSITLNPERPARGTGTYTTKYHLKRHKDDAYELDPVVIVDR